MAGLYQLFFIIFLVLAFFMGFVMTISRFDLKTATTNSTNKNLERYAKLLDEKITRMLEVKGQVIVDTNGFYRSLNKFSKRNRFSLREAGSFYYFEKDTSVQFKVEEIHEDGVVFSYEALFADDSSAKEVVVADRGVFKMAWRF